MGDKKAGASPTIPTHIGELPAFFVTYLDWVRLGVLPAVGILMHVMVVSGTTPFFICGVHCMTDPAGRIPVAPRRLRMQGSYLSVLHFWRFEYHGWL